MRAGLPEQPEHQRDGRPRPRGQQVAPAQLVERDVKGLYKKALAGEIKSFTGVSDPYEEPLKAELIVDSSTETVEQSLGKLLGRLEELNYINKGARR